MWVYFIHMNYRIANAPVAGITQLILAMPHRGRLNLLTGLLEYNPTALFHKIKGGSEVDESLGVSGDVLSHLGARSVIHHVQLS